MKKILILLVLIVFTTVQLFSQSTNCSTATNLSLTNGSVCVNGTSAGAITDNVLYGSCNTSPVNIVWYTYVTNGSNNNFTITPGTLTNAEIVIYQGGCPNTASAALQTCTLANGSSQLITNWGMTAGAQVWVGIASNGGVDGTFQLCVNSQPPAPGPGNTCATAKPVCGPFSLATMPVNSSGQKPNCFGSAPQRDTWVKFTITQSGVLAWTGMPTTAGTEFDWALWDITGGCPGTVVCCNYPYVGGSNVGFGMQAQAGTVTCGSGAGAPGLPAPKASEFSPVVNVTCGKTYAIQISNYDNTSAGFNLSFTNSTAMINSNAAFSVNAPTLVCGPSLNAVINNASTGACAEVWNYGDGSPTYTGTAPPAHTYNTPGTYAITANIGGACPSSATQFVQLLAPLAATATPSPVSCPGQCNGSATVSPVTGGDGVYTYLWSTGSASTSVNALCAGVYSVTVSNAKCNSTVTQTVNVTSPPNLTITANPTNASCGSANGSVLVSGSGGTGPYTYQLNAGAFSGTTNYTGLAGGTYTLTVKDNKGCTTFTTVTITQPVPPVVTVNSGTACAGGSVVLNGSGATTYNWSPATGLSATTGGTVTATPAVTTTYTLTGTTGACSGTATAMVTINPLPTPLATNTGPYCAGTTIQLNVGAFTTYTWTGPSAFASNSQNPTIPAATAGNGGVYTVSVTNANGCVNSSSTTVVINAIPTPTIGSNSPVCLGSNINLTSGGGTSYSWSGPAAFASAAQNPTISNAALTNSGLYTVTVTASGCSATASVNVVVTTPTTSASNTGPYCAGSTIQLNNPGASTYTWTGPAGFNSSVQNPTRPAATVAMSGLYTVLVSFGTCTASATTSVTVNALPVPTASNTGPYCPGNTISLSGSAASTFTWSGPAAFTSNSQNPNISAVTPANSGLYTYSVTDANGCVGGTTTSVTVNSTPTITINSNSPVCLNNNINLTASGGTSYSWSGPSAFSSAVQNPTVTSATAANAGIYTVTVTALSCTNTASVTVSVLTPTTSASNTGPYCAGTTIQLNTPGATSYTWSGPSAFGSNAQNPTRPAATVAMSGNYTVLVNIGTCTAIATTSVTVNALPVPLITSNSPVCVGKDVTFNGSGGSAYAWSGPSGFASALQNPTITAAAVSISGTYTLTVTNANGCINSTVTAVTVNAAPLVTASGATVCQNTNAQLNATGGVSYSWTGPAGFASLQQNPVIANASAVNAGQYTVFITDANTCTNTAVASITINPSASPSIGSNGPICAQNALLLTASGGNQYAWSGPNGFVSSVQNPTVTATSSLSSGVYMVNVTVNGGCGGTATLNVQVNPLPVPVISSGPNKGCAPLCVTYNLQSNPSAASSSWNLGNGVTINGGLTQSSCYSTAGIYNISASVVDVNGCQGSTTYTTEVYPKPTADFVCGPVKPIENLDEVNFTDISFGTPIAGWNWYIMAGTQFTTGLQNPSFLYKDAGIYPVVLIVKSDKGCLDTILKTVTIVEDFGIYVPNAFTPNGDGVNDYFSAKGYGITKFKMQIFDRWGESIFVSDDIHNPWYGTYQGRSDKICQDDVYIWKISVFGINGKHKEMTGHVTLLK
ncbi:MAG: hypothetical protein JWO32_1840 [Bacteroidetes bacterium]|nr:hypothetical protein [Bacteroidota bacterium]